MTEGRGKGKGKGERLEEGDLFHEAERTDAPAGLYYSKMQDKDTQAVGLEDVLFSLPLLKAFYTARRVSSFVSWSRLIAANSYIIYNTICSK